MYVRAGEQLMDGRQSRANNRIGRYIVCVDVSVSLEGRRKDQKKEDLNKRVWCVKCGDCRLSDCIVDGIVQLVLVLRWW